MSVSYIEINRSALRHNLRVIRSHLPAHVDCTAVVKADAYGHGASETMRIALEEGYNSAAVARVEEGVALRKDGFTCPVFTLGLPLPEEAETAVKYDLIVPVDDTVELEPFEEAAEGQGKILEVWLPIDTGMNRIGTHPEDVEGFLEKLKKYPHIHIHGTFTHMAKADIHDKTTARKQLEKFEEALSHMPQRLEKGFIISAANSAGVLDMPESWYNLARPGIILYGPHPSDEMDNMWDLEYPMRLISHITHVQVLRKGEAIGYGGTYVAEEDMRTATIPIGYADGFHRALSNKGSVLVNGKRHRIIGRICMDQMMITAGDDVQGGDEVVLLGRQGDEVIYPEEIAAIVNTIPHEVMCGLKRVPRIYVDE